MLTGLIPALQLEALDPQLVMDFGGPPPPRQPVPKMEAAELLEHFKPQIMQMLGLEGNEDTWQEVIEGQAEMAVAMRDRMDQIKSRDIWVRPSPPTLDFPMQCPEGASCMGLQSCRPPCVAFWLG